MNCLYTPGLVSYIDAWVMRQVRLWFMRHETMMYRWCDFQILAAFHVFPLPRGTEAIGCHIQGMKCYSHPTWFWKCLQPMEWTNAWYIHACAISSCKTNAPTHDAIAWPGDCNCVVDYTYGWAERVGSRCSLLLLGNESHWVIIWLFIPTLFIHNSIRWCSKFVWIFVSILYVSRLYRIGHLVYCLDFASWRFR
jgi:hypothetical protein